MKALFLLIATLPAFGCELNCPKPQAATMEITARYTDRMDENECYGLPPDQVDRQREHPDFRPAHYRFPCRGESQIGEKVSGTLIYDRMIRADGRQFCHGRFRMNE